MATKVDRKGLKMAKKKEAVVAQFSLPATEFVIQDYSCNLVRSALGRPSRLHITQNFLCLSSKVSASLTTVPLREVTDIRAERHGGVLPNALKIITKDEAYYLTGFNHRNEVYHLLMHIWRYPVVFLVFNAHSPGDMRHPEDRAGPENDEYAIIDSDEPPDEPARGRGEGPAGGGGAGDDGLPVDEYGEYVWEDDPNGGLLGGLFGRKQVVVEVEASENALMMAEDARDTGVETLDELNRQAEQIDRIERTLVDINNNLLQAEKEVKKMENPINSKISEYVGDRFDFIGEQRAKGPMKRQIKIRERRRSHLDVVILIKKKSDALEPGFVRFHEGDRWSVCHDNMREIGGLKFRYDDVAQCVVRARPLHLDIRFRNRNTSRFRLASSYIQAIVNEFVLRSECRVIFEPGVARFDYGSPKIIITSATRGDQYGGKTAAFFGYQNDTSDLISKTADPEIKRQLQQQEDNVDGIRHAIGDLKVIADTMGSELDRQNDQLDRLTGQVVATRKRIHEDTHKIERVNYTS